MDKAIKTTKLKCKLGHTNPRAELKKDSFFSGHTKPPVFSASAMIRNVSAVTPRKPGS